MLETYRRANSTLNEHLIRTTVSQPPSQTARSWMRAFLTDLDHPEQAFPVIHVAATSGKGSIATMIAEILRTAGFRTGLHTTPYLQVATEKLWLNGAYAPVDVFAELVDWIRPLAQGWRRPDVPLHGMASFAIALEFFRRAAVDVAVVEVGVGGREDLTRVVMTDVAVVGAIGLDHQRTLGETYEEIAWHKAGVIQKGCTAVALTGPGAAATKQQAAAVNVPVRVIGDADYCARVADDNTTRFTYRGETFKISDLPLAMHGRVQATNAALAVAAVEAWAHRHPARAIEKDHVVQGLSRAQLPGRLEIISPEVAMAGGAVCPCPVLLDGAHNADKLKALAHFLGSLHYRHAWLIYGQLATKAPDAMLADLWGGADHIVFSEPAVYGKEVVPAGSLADAFASKQTGDVRVVADPIEACQSVIQRAEPEDLIVVTGSLYLVGNIRALWYPDDEVLGRQKSWW